MMATREMALCFTLSALTASALTLTATLKPRAHQRFGPGQSHGPNDYRSCDIHAMRNRVPERKITNAGRRWPDVVQGRGKEDEGEADLYKVTSLDDPVLANGNKLCKGKSVTCLIVWKSDNAGKEAKPRSLASFSGQKFDARSPDDCGASLTTPERIEPTKLIPEYHLTCLWSAFAIL